jgi:hypothetical protein
MPPLLRRRATAVQEVEQPAQPEPERYRVLCLDIEQAQIRDFPGLCQQPLGSPCATLAEANALAEEVMEEVMNGSYEHGIKAGRSSTCFAADGCATVIGWSGPGRVRDPADCSDLHLAVVERESLLTGKRLAVPEGMVRYHVHVSGEDHYENQVNTLVGSVATQQEADRLLEETVSELSGEAYDAARHTAEELWFEHRDDMDGTRAVAFQLDDDGARRVSYNKCTAPVDLAASGSQLEIDQPLSFMVEYLVGRVDEHRLARVAALQGKLNSDQKYKRRKREQRALLAWILEKFAAVREWHIEHSHVDWIERGPTRAELEGIAEFNTYMLTNHSKGGTVSFNCRVNGEDPYSVRFALARTVEADQQPQPAKKPKKGRASSIKRKIGAQAASAAAAPKKKRSQHTSKRKGKKNSNMKV